MPNESRQPDRWETLASLAATAVAAGATIAVEEPAELALVLERLDVAPAWLRTAVSVPQPVWWVTTAVLAGVLFWVGLRLSRRWGSIALFLAPATMLALRYALPWLLYAPVRAALPSSASLL